MPSSTQTLSPLRYPGSKRRLANYIEAALQLNKLRPSLYIEPFVGGASVALQLLKNNLVDQVILADLDPWVASFWKVVFFDTEWLVEQIRTIEVTLEKWWEMKNSTPTTTRDQALTCFFLNRTNFSGILENKVGPIGGKKQLSKYKLDCRFMREPLIARIMEISTHQNKVYAIWECTWDECLQRLRSLQAQGSLPNRSLFFYLDPPFFEEAESLYRFYFKQLDHESLRDTLLQLTDKFILSYDMADQVQELYGSTLKSIVNGTRHHPVELLYSLASISERKRGKEVIISNLSKLPRTEFS